MIQVPYFNTRRRLWRLGKYQITSTGTFALDLLLIYLFLTYTTLPQPIIIAGCYYIAISVAYFVHYYWTFRGTTRKHTVGFGFFLAAASTSAIVIVIGVELATTVLGIPLLVSRVAVATVIGIATFLFNNFVTFLAD